MSSAQNPQQTAIGDPLPALVSAFTRLMRPLVRALIARGMTFPYVSNLLKAVYVDVAQTEFLVGEAEPTVSRLSVLTGLQRKDVKRILSTPPPSQSPPPSGSIAARLMGLWTSDARFLTETGKPKALPCTSNESSGDSFETLMHLVSSDVRPKVILEEWMRLGVVETDEKGFVSLNPEAFAPSRNFDEKAHTLGRNVADHMASSVHNMLGEGGTPCWNARSPTITLHRRAWPTCATGRPIGG